MAEIAQPAGTLSVMLAVTALRTLTPGDVHCVPSETSEAAMMSEEAISSPEFCNGSEPAAYWRFLKWRFWLMTGLAPNSEKPVACSKRKISVDVTLPGGT